MIVGTKNGVLLRVFTETDVWSFLFSDYHSSITVCSRNGTGFIA